MLAMGYHGDGGPSRARRGKSVRAAAAGERRTSSGADQAATEDGEYSRNRSNSSTMGLEFNDRLSFRGDSFEFKLNRGMKGTSTPMKSLINEEMSKEVVKRTSPCLVARLMGLDSLPSPVRVQPKKIGESNRKMSSSGCQDKYRHREGHMFHGRNNKEQEFKDVFEVTETLESQGLKKRKPGNGKKSSNVRHVVDLAYIQQKFLDAKRLSADESFHNSKELDDALEALDSNKDLFLKYLQEPNSLFTKHVENLRSSPLSHVNHITILRPAKGNRHEHSEECCSIDANADCFSHIQEEAPLSSRKSASRHRPHSLKDHNASSSQKLPSLKHESRYEFCSHPTKIVVLKPTLEKAWEMERTISLPVRAGNYEGRGYRRQREPHILRAKGFYADGKEKKLHGNLEKVLQRSKSSREIAREVTKQMRESVWYSTKKVLSSGIEDYEREKISCIESCMDSLYESDRHCQCADFNDRSTSLNSPSSYSTESSVCQEAKKRLSARWKMTQHLKEVEHIDRSSSTLGEMLALPDIEIPNRASHAALTSMKDCGKSSIEVTSRWVLGRKDGRKVVPSGNLPDILSRSSSLPAKNRSKPIPKRHTSSKRLKDFSDQIHESALKQQSNLSSFDRSFNCRIHRPQLTKSYREEHNLPEREIHVNTEVDCMSNILYSSEAKPTAPEIFDDCVVDRFHHGCGLPYLNFKDTKISCMNNGNCEEENRLFDILEKDTQPSNRDYNILTSPELSVCESADLVLHPQCSFSQPADVKNFEDIEHPSPVSVLETPSEEDNSSSGCFERISADLKELRMQLQLLKMESTDTITEQLEDMTTSDEHALRDCALLQKEEEKLEDFKDETDRDCFYLIDVFTESRIYDNWSCISDEFHMSDNPIHASVFDKLERKYSRMTSWLRSERKLLFDLINSVLAKKVVSPFLLHPWIGKSNFGPISCNKDLQEHVWQRVRWHRKGLCNEADLVLEPKWLCTIPDAELVRNDIEDMLVDELLEQLVRGSF